MFLEFSDLQRIVKEMESKGLAPTTKVLIDDGHSYVSTTKVLTGNLVNFGEIYTPESIEDKDVIIFTSAEVGSDVRNKNLFFGEDD
jgi:hypothetical protein